MGLFIFISKVVFISTKLKYEIYIWLCYTWRSHTSFYKIPCPPTVFEQGTKRSQHIHLYLEPTKHNDKFLLAIKGMAIAIAPVGQVHRLAGLLLWRGPDLDQVCNSISDFVHGMFNCCNWKSFIPKMRKKWCNAYFKLYTSLFLYMVCPRLTRSSHSYSFVNMILGKGSCVTSPLGGQGFFYVKKAG